MLTLDLCIWELYSWRSFVSGVLSKRTYSYENREVHDMKDYSLRMQFHDPRADISVSVTNRLFGQVLVRGLDEDPDTQKPVMVLGFGTQWVEEFRPKVVVLILQVGQPPEFLSLDLPHENLGWAGLRTLHLAGLQELRNCPAVVQHDFILPSPLDLTCRWFRGDDWQLDVTPYQDPLPAIAEHCLAR